MPCCLLISWEFQRKLVFVHKNGQPTAFRAPHKCPNKVKWLMQFTSVCATARRPRRFAGDTYWKIDGVTSPRTFFSHLSKIFPHGNTLLIEGLDLSLTAKSLYSEHPARYTRKVACDTMSPVPDSFHVEFRSDFADRLCQLIDQQGLAAAFYHFKGYSDREVIFTFHDAFEGELVVSGTVAEPLVREFAHDLGCSAQQTPAVDLRAQLAAIDRAMNPPWWKRALRPFQRAKNAD